MAMKTKLFLVSNFFLLVFVILIGCNKDSNNINNVETPVITTDNCTSCFINYFCYKSGTTYVGVNNATITVKDSSGSTVAVLSSTDSTGHYSQISSALESGNYSCTAISDNWIRVRPVNFTHVKNTTESVNIPMDAY